MKLRSTAAISFFICLFSCAHERPSVQEADFCDRNEYSLYKDSALNVCYAKKGTMSVSIPCATFSKCQARGAGY